MIKHKLTLYLSIIDGIIPQRRAIHDAIASINKKTETIFFIGFSELAQSILKKDIPKSYHQKFLQGRLDTNKEILHLIFSSSTKAVVFNSIIDDQHQKNRLKLILQLLNAGINVFVAGTVKNFYLCSQELKETYNVQIKGPLIPNSFFKYISRVILVNNFDESFDVNNDDCPIKALVNTCTEKNIRGKLSNMAFILATHINHQSKHFCDGEKRASYSHASINCLAKYIKIFQSSIDHIKSIWLVLKSNAFDAFSSTIPILASFFLAQYTATNESNYNSLLIFFCTASFTLNALFFSSFFPALFSVAYALILSLYMPEFNDINNVYSQKVIGLFMGLFLFYVIIQNNKIILQQKDELFNKEIRLEYLYLYTEALATSPNTEEIFRISSLYFNNTFKLDIILVLQDPYTIATKHIITPTSNSTIENTDETFTINQLADQYQHHEFIPLIADSVELGWIGMKSDNPNHRLDPVLLNSSILQLTIALQRYHLSQSYQSAILSSEKEQLRSIILSSISHDLKTPLTTIIGSCTALEELENLSAKHKMVLIHTIHEASDQLNQFISNILDSSRLASENLLQQTSLVYLDDVINVILQRSKKTLRLFDVSVTVTNSEEAAIYADFTLMQQVFFNIIENATKYVPIGGKIAIFVTNIMNKVFVRIYDNGPGIVESKRNLIFDKFYRFQHSDQQKAGTGLGLSICKQIVEAYKGKIWASGRDDGQKGAQFNIEFPCAVSQRLIDRKLNRVRK